MSNLQPFLPESRIQFAKVIADEIFRHLHANFPARVGLPIKEIADKTGIDCFVYGAESTEYGRIDYQPINGTSFSFFCNEVAAWLASEDFLLQGPNGAESWTLTSKGLAYLGYGFVSDP